VTAKAPYRKIKWTSIEPKALETRLYTVNYSEDRVVDEFLVMRCQAGDEVALSALVAKWQPPFMKYASVMTRERELAADVLQDAWIKIIKGLPRLRDPLKFPGWAYRIINNQCLDALRKQSVPEMTEGPSVSLVSASPMEILEPTEQVWWVLAQLTANHRSVLALHYLQGFDVSDIADITRSPVGTVKSRLHHAREKFRILLQEKEHKPTREQPNGNDKGHSGQQDSGGAYIGYRPA
jgi:RNA polymerase sigma factor (sigma-70 family)